MRRKSKNQLGFIPIVESSELMSKGAFTTGFQPHRKGNSKLSSQRGFTFPEIIIVIGFISILFGMVSFNLIGAQREATVEGVESLLSADIKQQQLKAMVGDSENTNERSSYGIYIESDRYTLFRGDTYVEGEPSNFLVSLPDEVILSGISETEIIFASVSGEVVGYLPGTLEGSINQTNGPEVSNFSINEYGAILLE